MLESGSSATISFTWNTTGVAEGNYTTGAVADTVPGETDTTDNTFVYGWVVVTILGDVTGDGVDDASDLFDLSKNYGKTV